MVDKLYAKYKTRKQESLDPQYKPSNAIVGRKLLNGSSDKLVVIFPGWHSHDFPINILAGRLNRKGWSVLVFDFHNQILEPEDEVVVESFQYIQDIISDDLRKLTSKHVYRRIHFIGISLGNVALALVSEKFPHFSGATFVVAGDDLAVDMWHGLRTLYLRDEFKKEGIGIRKLDYDWSNEAPKNHSRRFAGKPVKVIMSLGDRFILPRYQQIFEQSLERARANITVRKRRTGHILTIMRYCIFENPI